MCIRQPHLALFHACFMDFQVSLNTDDSVVIIVPGSIQHPYQHLFLPCTLVKAAKEWRQDAITLGLWIRFRCCHFVGKFVDPLIQMKMQISLCFLRGRFKCLGTTPVLFFLMPLFLLEWVLLLCRYREALSGTVLRLTGFCICYSVLGIFSRSRLSRLCFQCPHVAGSIVPAFKGISDSSFSKFHWRSIHISRQWRMFGFLINWCNFCCIFDHKPRSKVIAPPSPIIVTVMSWAW